MSEGTTWRVTNGDGGLRLEPVKVARGTGSEALTWADLLFLDLMYVQTYVLYFPSRFDTDLDRAVEEALRTFAKNTPASTSVNTWDPKDPEFSRALALFGLSNPPALTLATGLKTSDQRTINKDQLYAISFDDAQLLRSPEQLANAINTAHEVLARADHAEITRYVRLRSASEVLGVIGRIAASLRDGLVRMKPKVGLPGGFSLQVGAD